MLKIKLPLRLWSMCVWLLVLTACELNRADTAQDIDQFAPPPAQSSVSLRLEPLSWQLNVGEIATLQLRLDNAIGVSELDLRLTFNPAVLQVVDAKSDQDGVQIQPGDFFDPEVIADNQVDNAQGVIKFYAIPEPLNGSGLIATITIQAIASGASEVAFAPETQLFANGEGVALAPFQASQINVSTAPGQPTAIFTSTPSQPTLTPSTPFIAATGTVAAIVTVAPTSTPMPTFTPTPLPTPTVTNTPVAPQVCIPPDATVGFCYRVQFGEDLYSLGQKFSIDPRFISLVNDLNPPDYVYPQQILFMPQQYGHGPNIYLTQPGDTLTKIEQDCKLESGIVAQVNGLPRDATVVSGTRLIIPRPPYPPPSRYPYAPGHVWPPPDPASCTYQ